MCKLKIDLKGNMNHYRKGLHYILQASDYSSFQAVRTVLLYVLYAEQGVNRVNCHTYKYTSDSCKNFSFHKSLKMVQFVLEMYCKLDKKFEIRNKLM